MKVSQLVKAPRVVVKICFLEIMFYREGISQNSDTKWCSGVCIIYLNIFKIKSLL